MARTEPKPEPVDELKVKIKYIAIVAGWVVCLRNLAVKINDDHHISVDRERREGCVGNRFAHRMAHRG